jgi:hypothetical protein
LPAKIVIALCAVAAVACLAVALLDSSLSGDIYREYSSLRTDRLGASALYEALSSIEPNVTRNYQPLENLRAKNAAVLILNVTSPSEALLKACEALAGKGNRLIITFNAAQTDVALKRWNLNIKRGDHGSHLEAGPEWKMLPDNEEGPEAIERAFGSGTVAVLASPSPFSNIALRDHRDSAFLSRVLAGTRQIVFDESHLGSTDRGSIMGLARQFRLQGLIGVLLLCAGLFFWQSSVPFPPAPVTTSGKDFSLTGSETGEGLRNLLSRHIAPANLITACVAEWRRDRGRKVPEHQFEKINTIAVSAGSPVRQWKEIRSVLSDKTFE